MTSSSPFFLHSTCTRVFAASSISLLANWTSFPGAPSGDLWSTHAETISILHTTAAETVKENYIVKTQAKSSNQLLKNYHFTSKPWATFQFCFLEEQSYKHVSKKMPLKTLNYLVYYIKEAQMKRRFLCFFLCSCFKSQSTIFHSCQDVFSLSSWVNQYY